LSERIHCDEIIVTCNECRIKYIYIYIKCGDVSDACARLQKCEDEEEEILFFAEWRAIKFGGGSVLTRRRRRRSVFAKFFFVFVFVPEGVSPEFRRMYRNIDRSRLSDDVSRPPPTLRTREQNF